MTEEHANLFKLLVEVDELCNANNIDYCLAGGSSLGAVRNHCFLPWDDDVDLYITRENWNKLLKLYEENPEKFPKNRVLVCTDNEKYHRNPIARYVKTDTTIIFSGQEFSGKTCGQQVEFFIMDPIPNSDKGREEFYKYYKLYIELLVPYFITNKNASIEDFREHYKLYKQYCKKAKKIGFEKVIEELEQKVLTYGDNKEEFDTYSLRWGQRSLLHPKKNYEGKRYIEFEGREFPIAPLLEHSLRVDYGDSWMYIPSVEGQLTHNPIIEDLDRPFEEYTSLYINRLNRERLIDDYTENKKINMSLFVIRREIEMREKELDKIVFEKEFSETIVGRTEEIHQLICKKDFIKSNEILAKYYKVQLSKNMKRYNVLIDLGDEFMLEAITNYIDQGLYYLGNSLLQLRKNSKSTGLEKFAMCEKKIKAYREMSIARYDFKSREMVEDVLAKHKEFSCELDYIRTDLWLMFEKAACEEDYREIIEYCKEKLDIYNYDGELMAFLGRALLKLGQEEDAKKYYEKAVMHTRNGFVWYEAKMNAGIDKIKEA